MLDTWESIKQLKAALWALVGTDVYIPPPPPPTLPPSLPPSLPLFITADPVF